MPCVLFFPIFFDYICFEVYFVSVEMAMINLLLRSIDLEYLFPAFTLR